jgi:hypothetical protein
MRSGRGVDSMWTLCGLEVRQFRSSVCQAINDVRFGAAVSNPQLEAFYLIPQCLSP